MVWPQGQMQLIEDEMPFYELHRVRMDMGLCDTLGDHMDLNLMYVLLS